jgi:hypothetical protein
MKRYVVMSIGQYLVLDPTPAWVNHTEDATVFDSVPDAEKAARLSGEEDASVREMPEDDGTVVPDESPAILRIATALERLANRLDGFASEEGEFLKVHVQGTIETFDADELERRNHR